MEPSTLQPAASHGKVQNPGWIWDSHGGTGRTLTVQRCLLFSPEVASVSVWRPGLEPTRPLCPVGFPRQEYCSGLPFPSLGDLPDPGLEPTSPVLAGWILYCWATREAQLHGIQALKKCWPPPAPTVGLLWMPQISRCSLYLNYGPADFMLKFISMFWSFHGENRPQAKLRSWILVLTEIRSLCIAEFSFLCLQTWWTFRSYSCKIGGFSCLFGCSSITVFQPPVCVSSITWPWDLQPFSRVCEFWRSETLPPHCGVPQWILNIYIWWINSTDGAMNKWLTDRLWIICIQLVLNLGFPCGSAGKESTFNEGDLGSIPGLGRYPGEGKGYPLQYSGLKNSMDYTVHGIRKSWTRLSNFHFIRHIWINSLKKQWDEMSCN